MSVLHGLMMGNLKHKTEGGHKRGHSNMDHWVYTDEIKTATRKRRRAEAKEIIREGMTGLREIYVHLENEGTEVWRPVDAKHIEADLYLIPEDTVVPDDETWQFQPGTVVRCTHADKQGEDCLIAVETPRQS